MTLSVFIALWVRWRHMSWNGKHLCFSTAAVYLMVVTGTDTHPVLHLVTSWHGLSEAFYVLDLRTSNAELFVCSVVITVMSCIWTDSFVASFTFNIAHHWAALFLARVVRKPVSSHRLLPMIAHVAYELIAVGAPTFHSYLMLPLSILAMIMIVR